MAAARAEHQLQSAVLDELAAILQSRVRERYDWDNRWAPRGPYPTSEFVPPARNWSADTEAAIVRAAAPVLRLAVPAAFIAAIALAVGGIAIRVGSAVLLAATALWTYHALQARQRMLVQRLDRLEAEYQDDVNSLRHTHDAREHVAREEWLEQERARERIRTSIDRQDLEALTLVLDDELQNEALPIECVFDVDMENVEVMTLSLVLPSIDAIPEHRTALTARGKLSTRAMSQRDRVGLYSDVCTGLALRLLYEIFRVLPCVREVTLHGELMRTNPATGYAELVKPLHVHTTRADLAALNLDAVESSTAFSGLGGKFACDRRGDVKNVSD